MSLSDGGAGVTLALAHLGKRSEDGAMVSASATAWSDTVLGLAREPVAPGLYRGFCGVGWVDAFLGSNRGERGGDDAVHEDIERVLLAHLALHRTQSDIVGFDLLSGLVGFGVYALERLGRGRSIEILDVVIDELVVRGEEIGCPSRAATSNPLPEVYAYEDPGMAHGLPGVVALLARAARVGRLPPRGWNVLERGVLELIRCQRPMPNGLSYMPIRGRVGPTPPGVSRVAWCYGDLGVAAALLLAGECCERGEWSQEAQRLATKCANVPLRDSGVLDHGLCHGTAGVAHTLARMAARLNDEGLWEGARRWLRWTLHSRRGDVGIDGFAYLKPRCPEARTLTARQYYFATNTGFLVGAAGVALALAASFSDEAPDWDRVLLLSA